MKEIDSRGLLLRVFIPTTALSLSYLLIGNICNAMMLGSKGYFVPTGHNIWYYKLTCKHTYLCHLSLKGAFDPNIIE